MHSKYTYTFNLRGFKHEGVFSSLFLESHRLLESFVCERDDPLVPYAGTIDWNA